MPLTATDVVFRAPQTISDAASNGGRMTNTVIPEAKNAIFPDVRQAERLAGSDRYRKVFVHFAGDGDAMDVKIVPFAPTPAGDTAVIYLGSQEDTQDVFTAALPPRAYGAAIVVGSLQAGADTITVQLEPGAPVIFAPGDLIYITNKANVSDPGGAELYATVASAGAPDANLQQTLTLTAPAPYQVDDGHGTVRAASVLQAGDALASIVNVVPTTASGAVDATAYSRSPIGAVFDDWTLTFLSPTTFACSGSRTGPLSQTGQVGTAYLPVNTNAGAPYFYLQPGFLGGTWAAGETVTFRTMPAAVPLWLRRIVPAGTATFALNRFDLLIDFEVG